MRDKGLHQTRCVPECSLECLCSASQRRSSRSVMSRCMSSCTSSSRRSCCFSSSTCQRRFAEIVTTSSNSTRLSGRRSSPTSIRCSATAPVGRLTSRSKRIKVGKLQSYCHSSPSTNPSCRPINSVRALRGTFRRRNLLTAYSCHRTAPASGWLLFNGTFYQKHAITCHACFKYVS